MSFWNINLDDWVRRRQHFDESVSAYMFSTSGWYDDNNWYNEYLEFHDIAEWYKADLLEKEDLLEEFPNKPHYNKQEWPEEYQTIPEEQINLEPFISYYYSYINASTKVGSRRRKKETKEFKRSPSHRLSSYVNNSTRAFVYPEPNVLYREEKEAVSGQKGEQDYYPLEIIRSNDLIRITTQTPLVDDKNYIKVKIYNDRSIEISIDDDTLQKNKKYYRIIEVPKDADSETAKCTYRNGTLEITFKQKKRYLHH